MRVRALTASNSLRAWRPARVSAAVSSADAAVGGGEVLDAAEEALPEMEAVADLHGIGGAGRSALPVCEGAVAADDLDTRVLAEPPAELFGVASFPKCEREPGGGVDQEGAVGVAVKREVIHPQHPWCLQWRKRHPHQLRQDVHRESLVLKIRSIRAPPRPASATPTASTRRCNCGVRRW